MVVGPDEAIAGAAGAVAGATLAAAALLVLGRIRGRRERRHLAERAQLRNAGLEARNQLLVFRVEQLEQRLDELHRLREAAESEHDRLIAQTRDMTAILARGWSALQEVTDRLVVLPDIDDRVPTG